MMRGAKDREVWWYKSHSFRGADTVHELILWAAEEIAKSLGNVETDLNDNKPEWSGVSVRFQIFPTIWGTMKGAINGPNEKE